jgi:hypothetical protein
MAVVKLCYGLFREANPNWKEMLGIWHEAHLLEKTDETVQQRRNLFEKCFDKVRKAVSR